MTDQNCEVCKADLGFSRVTQCSIGGSVHAILCQSCRTTMDRRVMALPQWRRHQQLLGSLEVLHELAASGRDTREEVRAALEEWASLQIALHDTIIAILGRPAPF